MTVKFSSEFCPCQLLKQMSTRCIEREKNVCARGWGREYQGSGQRKVMGGGGGFAAPPPPYTHTHFPFSAFFVPFNGNAVDSQHERVHKGMLVWGEVSCSSRTLHFALLDSYFQKLKNGLWRNCLQPPPPPPLL